MIALLQNNQNEIKTALNLQSILYFLRSSDVQTPWSCMTSERSQNVALDRNKLNTGQTCYISESLQTNTVASFPMTCSTTFLLRLTQFLFDTSRLLASPALLPIHKEPPSFTQIFIIIINNHRSSGFRSNHWSFIATVLFRMVRNCRTTLIRQLQRLTVKIKSWQ